MVVYDWHLLFKNAMASLAAHILLHAMKSLHLNNQILSSNYIYIKINVIDLRELSTKCMIIKYTQFELSTGLSKWLYMERKFNCRGLLCIYTDLELNSQWLLCCSNPEGFGAKNSEKTDHGVWKPHLSLLRKGTLSVTQSSERSLM